MARKRVGLEAFKLHIMELWERDIFEIKEDDILKWLTMKDYQRILKKISINPIALDEDLVIPIAELVYIFEDKRRFRANE